jgi:N-methylhydantoinase B
LIREIELLSDTQITVLSERRTFAPYGLAGGQPGTTGKNVFISKRQETILPGKCNFRAQAGDIIRIETPGGGGWGKGSDS